MTPEKLIQRIGILLILTFLFEVIRSFQMLEVVLLSLKEEFKFNLVLSVFVTLLLPVAGVLMWYKKKLGWTLICSISPNYCRRCCVVYVY
jgi:hypothetical protein